MALPWIISVDDHVIEPPDLWQSRLPAKLRERGPRVVRRPWERGEGLRQSIKVANSGPEAEFWQVDDLYQVITNIEGAAGRSPAEMTGAPIDYADMRPGCYQVKPRLEDLDEARIERSLCFPNVCRFAGQLFLWLDDKELGLACVQAYNDWMVEEWAAESDGRLIPLCMVPLWDPVLAAAEIRRNAARGVRAVTFSELPSALGLPSIHAKDGHWIPFIEACNETGTVICMHIGSGSSVAVSSADAPPRVKMSTLSLNNQLAFADWMYSGLLVTYPNLKLAFSESQIGWMPYMLERMDRVWRVNNAVAHMDPIFVNEPSSYLAGRVYGCFFEDDFGIDSRHAIGVDQITFECDYPHQDSTWPHTYEYLSGVLADIPEDEAYKIARGNAIRMLELEPSPQHDAVAARG